MPCFLFMLSLVGIYGREKAMEVAAFFGRLEVHVGTGYPDPLKDPNNGTPQNDPITTLRKLGDYWEAPILWILFGGSGIMEDCIGFHSLSMSQVWGIFMGTMGLNFPASFLAHKTKKCDFMIGSAKEARCKVLFSRNPGRMFGAFLILLRAVANGSLLVYSAWVLPPRNPDQNLNLSKYLLAWFEIPLAVLMAVSCLFWLVMIYRKPDKPHQYTAFARNVRRLGRFSAFSSLPYANPAVMLSQLQVAVIQFLNAFLQSSTQAQMLGITNVAQVRDKEDIKDLLSHMNWLNLSFLAVGLSFVVSFQMVFNALFAGAAAGSVVVKTSQLSFVSEKPWDEWTFAEGIALASFINALSGLGLDPNILGLVKVR